MISWSNQSFLTYRKPLVYSSYLQPGRFWLCAPVKTMPGRYTGQVLYGLLLSGLNPVSRRKIESCVPPVQSHFDKVFFNLASWMKHFENFMCKDLFLGPCVKTGCNPEHGIPVRIAIRTEHGENFRVTGVKSPWWSSGALYAAWS